MKRFLSLMCSFMLASVSFAQLNWVQTTYRTENISGSYIKPTVYVCQIKDKKYTFTTEMAVAAEKYLNKASVVHVFKLNSSSKIAVYALDNYEGKIYLGADYILKTDDKFSYYNERSNGMYTCTSSAFMEKKRKLSLIGKNRGFLIDENGNVVIYD